MGAGGRIAVQRWATGKEQARGQWATKNMRSYISGKKSMCGRGCRQRVLCKRGRRVMAYARAAGDDVGAGGGRWCRSGRREIVLAQAVGDGEGAGSGRW